MSFSIIQKKIALEATRAAKARAAVATTHATDVSGSTTAIDVVAGNAHDLTTLAAAINIDKNRLHELEGIDAKIALKRDELVPKYLPMVNAYLDRGVASDYPLLSVIALWALDAGFLDDGMRLANAAITQQQKHAFKSTMASTYGRAIALWAETEIKAERSAAPYIFTLCEWIEADTHGETWADIDRIVLGQCYKQAGLQAVAHEHDARALHYFTEAQARNDRAGVKGRIKTLTAKLAEAAKKVPPG